MKKFILLFLVCSLFAGSLTGCADVAAGNMSADAVRKENADNNVKIARDAVFMEEGYYMIEGMLCEMDKGSLALEAGDGQVLYFELAPETVICSGENDEIVSGQRIKVVFDGDFNESGFEKVSVIAVTLAEA